jgi:hypothetical protein
MANPIVDFEQIAQNLLHAVTQAGGDARPVAASELIVEQLRQVWNARGAADMAMVGHELFAEMGAAAAGPYGKSLDRALLALDR